jgi:ketosteroid isomerase-like protein
MYSETVPATQLFYQETQLLFHCVEHHDFDTLAALCDDDFGIVDIAPDGNSVVIHDREGWENWFRTLFAQLSAMQARTYTDITHYRALAEGNMGYCAVEFCQHLEVGGQHHKFFCVATIIWKKVSDDKWKESRWHCSVVRREVA